ncbi:hypothetical protein Tco_1518265 [Tanacetum coccineum]
MTCKLDDMIELPKSQPKRTYNEDSESEIVMVKMPKCMAWLDDESIGYLDMMEDKVDNPSPQCTPQVLPSIKFPSVDELEPQPLPNLPFLDVSLGGKRGIDPPINPYSLGSFRMKGGPTFYASNKRRVRIMTQTKTSAFWEATQSTIFLHIRSLEVLRKFHWTILRGQFNQLSYVSSPLLSKLGEY